MHRVQQLQHKKFMVSRLLRGGDREMNASVRPMRFRYHAHFVSQHS